MKQSVTSQIHALIEKFENVFMKPEILTRLTVSQVDNEYSESRFVIQGEEYLEKNETITATYENVSLCRLSASGYTDCTDWTLCHDENDILDWLYNEAEYLTEIDEVQS